MIVGALFGFFAVAIGAFGAHALRDSMSEYGHAVFQTGWHYHMAHTLVLLIIPLIGFSEQQTKILIALFATGILIFSGTLYILGITEMRWLGAITPIGGTLLLIGWGYLVYLCWRGVS